MLLFKSWLCPLLSDESTGCVNHFIQGMSFSPVFQLIIMDFDLSSLVGDKFFQSNDSGTINWLLGIRQDLQRFILHFYQWDGGVWKELNSWSYCCGLSFKFCSIYYSL